MTSKSFLSLLVTLTLCAGLSNAQVRALDKVAAIVDDNVIMQSQLDRRVHDVLNNITAKGGELPPRETLILQVLERLIVEDLQLQIADRYGIRVEDDELNQSVEDLATRNNMTQQQFSKSLEREGLSLAALRNQMKQEIVISRVRQYVVGDRVKISEQEVKNFLNSELAKIQLSEEYYLAIILVPIAQGSSSSVSQKAEQRASSIYAQLQDGADFARLAISNSKGETALDGGEIGWRQAAQLPPPFDRLIGSLKKGEFSEPVSTPGGFAIVKVLDKRGGSSQMSDETSVRHILLKPSQVRSAEASRELAKRLYDRIMAGEDFAELAKKFSDDPGSAARGGDLNWIDPNVLVPEFRKVMGETAVGNVSKPFRSSFGWHILQVQGRRSKDNSADYKKQQAREILFERKYAQELVLWLQQLRDEAYIEIRN